MMKYDMTPYATLILRLTMGILFLTHVWVKLFVFTPSGTAQYFSSLGLPGFLAYIVIACELLGGVALLLGIFARPVALLMTIDLLGAIVNVHWKNGFLFNNPNGGWEFPALWIICLLTLALSHNEIFALKPISIGDKVNR